MTVQELMRVLVNMPDHNLNVTINGQEVSFVGADQSANSINIEAESKEVVNEELATEEKFAALPKDIQYQISEILNHFRFAQVHEFMEMINWTWRGEGVPSVYKLRECAKTLLVNVCYSSYTDTSKEGKYVNHTNETGGFFARARDNGNKVELRFNLEWYGNM